ncbi:5'-nucleotidase [Minicystis rosea]|nr:5'-nucleotidase [Minicystis rosea]
MHARALFLCSSLSFALASAACGGGGAGTGGSGGGGSTSTNSSTTTSSTTSSTSSTGGAGGTGGSGGATTSSTGTGGGCTTTDDCPLPPNECVLATCNGGVCGTTNAAAGTLGVDQTDGDCQTSQCDGMGHLVMVATDTDVPDDGNPCTKDLCTNGTPSNPAVSQGTSCGGTLTCDGAGHCTGCTQASDCPGQDTTCKTRTCSSNMCGVSVAPSGTLAGTQTAGDCHKSQCDGMGNIVNAIDNTDVPVDNKQCTGDVCTGGVASNPALPTGTTCAEGGGKLCDGAGQCVQCNAAADCGANTACQTHTCMAGACMSNNATAGTVAQNPTMGDCKADRCDGMGGINAGAVDDTDVPVDNNPCTGDVCTNGVPSNPALMAGTACNQGGGKLCDGAGHCVQCITAADCGTDTACQTHTCNAGMCDVSNAPMGTVVTNPTVGDCRSNRCDGAGNLVTNAPDDTDLPVDNNQCTSDVCTNGVAGNPPLAALTACTQNGGVACDGMGTCVAAPTVASTSPADASTPVAGADIAVTFSAAMNPATLTAQTTAGACSGSIQVSLDGFASCIAFSSAMPVMSGGNTVATLTAAPGLLVRRTYQIRVTTAAQSTPGLSLASQYTSPSGFLTQTPDLCAGSVVVSQVFGGGGNAGSVYKNDFIELHNRGTTPVSLAGWSVQYASATSGTWAVTTLSGTIQPGAYYLVQEAAGTGGTTNLPTPDATGSIAMAAGSGKIALVSSATALTGTCPSGGSLVDLVGYGTANCSEGSSTGATSTAVLTATTAATRIQSGCADVDSNNADFTAPAPNPRNSASPVGTCKCDVQNESSAALEADYCDTQSPSSVTVMAGMSTPTIYGRLYESGTTGAGSANASVRAQVGYGPAGKNPEYEAGWTWVNATYNTMCTGCGNNDEYQASFMAPAAGTYRYIYRFSLDQGVSWTYCDYDQGDHGAGSNPNLAFDFADEAVLTSQ